MNNEITFREDLKRELIIEYTFKGIDYCLKHPVMLYGIGLSAIVMATCVIIEKNKGVN